MEVDRPRKAGRLRQAASRRLLSAVTLPLHRHMETVDGFRFESARMLTYALAYVMNERIGGDYAEFGVLSGSTFIEAWGAIQRFELDANLHAYDSFAGLPEVRGHDQGGPFSSGEFASPRRIFDMTTARIPTERMTVTEGFFADTLPNAEQHPIAVAFVDCDLYESAVPVLDFLSSQLRDGAVLAFDDWFCFHGRPDKGEQRACGEWLERNAEIRLVPYRDFHWAGRSFIVNRG